MRKFRKGIIFLLTVLLVLASAGCSFKEASRPALQQPSIRHKVYVIGKGANSQFWATLYEGAQAAAVEYNLDLTIAAPEHQEDYQEQNRLIEEAARNADAIILSAIDYRENALTVDEASLQGVRIITVDSTVDSDRVLTYIGTDNYAAGKAAAEAALQGDRQEIHLLVIGFGAGTENIDARVAGIRDFLGYDRQTESASSEANAVAYPVDPKLASFRILEIKEDNDRITQMIEETLTDHPEINTIIATNQITSVACARAIRELALGETTWMVGFDSSLEVIDMMQSGEVDALIIQNPYAMGYLGVEEAYQAICGQFSGDHIIETSNSVVYRDNMFTSDSQKILFNFR